MNRKSLDISGKIDSSIVSICEGITAAANELSIPYLIVGAAARDIILHLGYDIPLTRGTEDIDFGVRVASWSEYENLKEKLIASGDFASSKTAR